MDASPSSDNGTASAAGDFRITPPQFWRTGFGSAPWVSMVGDADCDGHGDLLASATTDGTLQIARTSPLGKPLPDTVARTPSGPAPVAAAGRFLRKGATDVVTISADGTIGLTWGMERGTGKYLHAEAAGQVSPELVPQTPARTAVADFDGDYLPDVLVVDREGRLLVLRNDGKGRFDAHPLKTRLPGSRQLAAGTLAGDRFGRCVWLNEAGNVLVAQVDLKTNDLGAREMIGEASPDDHLAVGRFRGEKAADILVGQRLFIGGNPKNIVVLKDLPSLVVAKDDGVWEVADVDGNGKDDLIRHHEGRERFGAHDVYVHFSYEEGEDKGYYSTANDGLPDVWKTGKMKPGGLDLAALGCKVGHRDVILEVESFDNFDRNELRVNMDRAVQYFASIPLANPDGTTGIALHVIYKGPWPLADHDKVMAKADATFPPSDRRGVVHTMFAEVGGPLVSAINWDFGHFNGHWQEFAHEFGHQLDLSHDGFYGSGSGWTSDTGSAIYPSLMSYAYSYGYEDHGDWVRYSDGKRASLVLDPRHLSERLPFPIEDVCFLSAGPYRFRMEPTPDGKATLIDWNWNGVLGEEDVSANVKYTHGTDFGPSINVATTTAAPILVAHGGGAKPRPLLIYRQNAALVARSWVGRDRDAEGARWSDVGADYASGIVGDPSAAYLGEGVTWVAYSTARGVVLRKATLDGAGKPILGPPTVLAGTVGAQPTVVALDGRLALLLWRNKALPVGLTMLQTRGAGLSVGGERPLDLRSDVPVGATVGRTKPGGTSLWVGRIVPEREPEGGRTEVVRLEVGAGGASETASRLLVTGLYARQRMTLLWQEAGPKLPDGRLYLLGGGIAPGGAEGYEMFVSMNTPYPDIDGGWMVHRYRGGGFRGRAAPGACLFEGDILVSFRYPDDKLDVGFYGTGATPWPTGDFDDIGHIRDYGLSRSIRGFGR